MPFWRWRENAVGLFREVSLHRRTCSGLEWRHSCDAIDVSFAWFGGHVLPAAFAAVFARRKVRLRSAFAVLLSALKVFFRFSKVALLLRGPFAFSRRGMYHAFAVRFSLGHVLPRRVFSLAEFRVSVICCELGVSPKFSLQNILLVDCCRRAVCALPRCFLGCVSLRVSGLLGDLMNNLLRPIAVVLLACCATPCCVC